MNEIKLIIYNQIGWIMKNFDFKLNLHPNIKPIFIMNTLFKA
jgi:hypothetical protein